MTTDTRDANNRVLAEFVGCQRSKCGGDLCWHGPNMEHFGRSVPDFYTSEEASALLLDALHKMRINVHLHWATNDSGDLVCLQLVDQRGVHLEYTCQKDRKTALAQATLALIRKEEGK